MTADPRLSVGDVPARNEFVARLGDEEVGVLSYVVRGGVIDLRHTVVSPEHEGRGIGTALVRAALDMARTRNYQVIPTCSFVPPFIARNSQYRDLVVTSR